ncbi:ACT domain-containing protein [Oceanispirochaeta crateris]|uniref:ACT domain-containing protein n=1 Tax=Oceanispirochaeta crateris TaxID=2518645 RepID=A0A5C1QQY4_9SPIO|nr:ACT domain-containing protein [Oceanispirochaeta crateris]QEN09768.1 ACT domain-containing protein [Oceanispirochaeta crateris]
MSGEENLQKLLQNMTPTLDNKEYVFITTEKTLREMSHLNPLGTFIEEEGLTLIIQKKIAQSEGLKFDGVFKKITLQVHSSLDAVGLTAVVASKLKEDYISANVVAAYYHDHIFVQSTLSEKALDSLKELTIESRIQKAE